METSIQEKINHAEKKLQQLQQTLAAIQKKLDEVSIDTPDNELQNLLVRKIQFEESQLKLKELIAKMKEKAATIAPANRSVVSI